MNFKYLIIIVFLICLSCQEQKNIMELNEDMSYTKLEKEHLVKELCINDNKDTLIYETGDIKFDESGNIYITDIAGFSVKKFNPAGNLDFIYGRRGESQNEFKLQPFRLALDKQNRRIAINLFQAPIIKIVDYNFNFIDEIILPLPSSNMDYDNMGNLIIGIPSSKNKIVKPIIIYNKEGKLINSFIPEHLTGNLFFDMFFINYNHKFNKIVLLYICRNLIQVYEPSGKLYSEFSIPFLPSLSSTKKIDNIQNEVPTRNLFWGISSNNNGLLYILSGHYAKNGNQKEIYEVSIDGNIKRILLLEQGGKVLSVSDNDLYISFNENTGIVKYKLHD